MENVIASPIPAQEEVVGVPLPAGPTILDEVNASSPVPSVDDHLRTLETTSATTVDTPIQNVNTMAHSLEQASEGTLTYDDALKNLMADGGYSSKVVRDYAAASYVKDISTAKEDFNIAAARGNVVAAEQQALYIDTLSAHVKSLMQEKAITKITRDAAVNIITANPTAIENNSVTKIYNVSNDVGSLNGVKEIMDQYLVKKGIAPSQVMFLGTLGAAIGGPLAAGFANPIAGILAGTAVGAKFSYDAFVTVPDAIFRVTGIPRDVVGYANQIQAFRARLSTLAPQEALNQLVAVADYIASKEQLPGEIGKVFTALNVMRLYDNFDVDEWSKLSLSLKTQEFLDRVGLGFDSAGVLRLMGKAFNVAKTGSSLAGAPTIGAAIGNDIVNGTTRIVESAADQVGFGLSMDVSKYLPDGVAGTSAAVQKSLEASLKATLETLEQRLRVSDDPQAKAVLDFVRNNTEKTSPNIVGANLDNGELLIQHPSGTPFKTRAEADAYARSLEGAYGVKMDVVAATDGATGKITTHGMMDDVLVGYHSTDKNFTTFKESGVGAYGKGVYVWLDNAESIRGAVQKIGTSLKTITIGKSQLIDVSLPMAQQSQFIQNAAKSLGVSDVAAMADLGQDVLKNAGVKGIMNTKFNPSVGQPQANIFSAKDAKIVSRRLYTSPEDVTMAAYSQAMKGDRTALDALGFKETLYKSVDGVFTPNAALAEAQQGLIKAGQRVDGKTMLTGVANKLLTAIRTSSVDDAHRILAGNLLRLSEQLQLNKIKFGVKTGMRDAGVYTSHVDEIFFDRGYVGNETLVLHEIAHAVSTVVLEAVQSGTAQLLGLTAKQIKAAEDVIALSKDKNLMQRLVDATANTGEAYKVEAMLLDPHELLAYGLTERGIIHKVLSTYKVGGKTVLNRIAEFIADMLGLSSASAFIRLNADFFNMVGELSYAQRIDNMALATDAAEYASRMSITNGWYVRHAGSPMVHTTTDIESRFGAGLDPIHRASELSVHDRTITLLQEAKDKNALKKFLDDGFKGLTRKENKRVVSVLEEGDTLSKEFNDIELEARGLTNDRMKKAYYTYRTVSNLDLAIKNQTIKENLTRRGFTQGFIKDGAATHTVPARTVNTAEYEGLRAYNLVTGKMETIDVTKHIGMRVVETASPVSITGKGEHTRFISDGTNVTFGNLYNQIPNRKGSFRHYYTQDYFGSVNIQRMVNGETVTDTLHLRTSNSGKDMGKWKAGMEAVLNAHRTNPGSVTAAFIESKLGRLEDSNAILAAINKGEWDNYTGFNTHYDRTNDAYIDTLAKAQWDDDLAKNDGRGMRLQSIDSNKDNILDPIKAIQSEISNVARHRNIDEWRDKWVQTWWNTFSQYIPETLRNSGKSPLAIISDPSIQLSTYIGGENISKFAESQRKYILAQLGVKTLDEKLIEGALVRFTNAFSEDSKIAGLPIGKPLVTAGHALRNADPLQFARSFNFFTMLAAFNPAQLIVQGAGAINAIAVSPVHGLKAAYTAPLLRIALMSDNPAVWSKVATLQNVAMLGMSNTQEFVDTVRSIRKSGLVDNIVSTSMHSAETGRYNIFTGTAAKLGEKSAFFFNRGEEFARLVSFDVARREWINKHPGASWTTDDALKNIISRQDDLTQNMTRANQAFYQRGVLSIPGQFLQYNLKLAANMIGSANAWATGKPYRGFTMGETASILAFHIAAYGMAGNGLMALADEVVGGYEKIVGRKSTDDEKLVFSQGMIAGLINEVSQLSTGQDLKLGVGSRLGTFEYYDKLARTIMAGDSSFWEVAMGPSYGSASRLGAMEALIQPIVRKDLSVTAFAEALNTVGKEVFSSWRNVSKAYYAQLHEGSLPNKEQLPIVKLSNPEIIAQAIGLGSSVEQDYWQLKLNLAERRKAVQEFAKTYIDLQEVSLKELTANGNSERYKTLTNYMTTLHSPLPSGEMDYFWSLVKKPKGVAAVAPFADAETKMRAEYLRGNWVLKDVVTTRSGAIVDVQGKENK